MPAPSRASKLVRPLLVLPLLLGGLVFSAEQARAEISSVYTTPGDHTVNGREWRTTCGAYSSQVTRCWAYIWGSKVVKTPTGQWGVVSDWVFNNLTYIGGTRAVWGTNRLANPGTWTDVDGRPWKTICGDAWTGPDACRTFVWTTFMTRDQQGRYVSVSDWLFNNVVRFDVPTSASPTPSPTPSISSAPPSSTAPASSTATPSPRPTATSSATDTPTPTAMLTPTVETTAPSPSPSPEASRSASPTVTPSTTQSVPPSPTPSPTQTSSPSPEASPSASAVPGEPSASPSPSSSPTAPAPTTDAAQCGAVIPAGFLLNGDGHPYPAVNPGYTPLDAFNPITIENFIHAASRANTGDARTCVVRAAANYLLSGSVVETYEGSTVRWLPYPFTFSANPSVEALKSGWKSGLGQGGALGAMTVAGDVTGDPSYVAAGQEVANSMDVPLSAGGIKNYITVGGRQLLWFEEYPVPGAPTTVLNGNNHAVTGLYMWAQRYGDERAKTLADEAAASYEDVVGLFGVPVESGALMSSYDLVRGFETPSPLRLVSFNGAMVSSAVVAGTSTDIPVVPPSTTSANLFTNGGFTTVNGWAVVGPSDNAVIANGRLTITPAASGYNGAVTKVAAGTVPQGTDMLVQFDARMVKSTTGATSAPTVIVQAACPTGYVQLARPALVRGETWGTYSAAFTAPAQDCRIDVFAAQATLGRPGGTLEMDNIVVRRADAVGISLEPTYDYYVWRTPTNSATVTGSGPLELQAYRNGRWERIERFTASSTPHEITIPERFTGRNINEKYHDSHIGELRTLGTWAGLGVFSATADAWVATALTVPN